MKMTVLSNIINIAFQYVIKTSEKYNIDESHALKHSMDVFHYSNKIYQSEIQNHPYLQEQKEIIFISSILHDMCDKKYMDEKKGIQEMCDFMKCKSNISQQELDIISTIISTMSYSTVKKQGYPELGKYQLAYHIVRESDLLTAYELERCIIYKMKHDKYSYDKALELSIKLFDSRILKYIKDNLFITNYSKTKAEELHQKAIIDIENANSLFNFI
jgi:hypothetical protein